MLFYETFAILCWIHAVASFPLNAYDRQRKRDVNPALVPSFGWQAGIHPDGTGNCDGAVNGTSGKPILVPCQCPPNSTFFLAALNENVAAGFVTKNPSVKVTFPTDNSTASQLARLNAAAVTLQNLEGPGVGCPISSTTFSAQNKAIAAKASNANGTTTASGTPSSVPTVSTGSPAGQTSGVGTTMTPQASPSASSASGPSTNTSQTNGVTTPAISPSAAPTSIPSTNASHASRAGSCSAAQNAAAATMASPTLSSAPSPPSPSSITNATSTVPSSGNTTTPTDGQIAALAPSLGWQSGINPDGTGNCDGAVNGTDGKPVLIPCQCPPDQADYISNLTANIRAGHVVLNPTVLVTFPTDNSTASQSARLNAAAVTTQNLVGAGKGCPIASTNFKAQSKAISAEASG